MPAPPSPKRTVTVQNHPVSKRVFIDRVERTIKINIVSRKFIEPSTPTLENLRTRKLSCIDELNPALNVVGLLYYPSTDNIGNVNNLEKSIAVEPVELNDILPVEASVADEASDPIMFVQINKFKCGGIAIATTVSHRIVDASSLGTFLSIWAKCHWEWWNVVQKNTKSLDFERLVPLLSNATRKTVSDCVKLLSNGNEGHKILVDAFVSAADKSHDDNLNGIWLSDWSKFGFYDIDFGFGKLIWTSIVNVPVKNFITMFNTKDNDGIEAWVNLHVKYMPYFEQDEEIKKLTT
ncbi:pelargonidin 3-O-(6-caffeoylglucoside) 5-O-(6-O-malonylglucoside) 4'''-malonyltransferase-like [Forsythia ovata]|uniref:Pelargonidin 3-O-(6-caffeoylglucoside) 5-O-(6-O-malonylglucoside) 4'''-malonyltransferase-like n=1 Tax=Forsythia ovata TaxID=205694 RepID=A0ABD1S1F6_9LAMI